MGAFFTLVLIVPVALGVYNYLSDNSLSTRFTDDLPEHITIEGDISLRERAEQGGPVAQNNLGTMHDNGDGVAQEKAWKQYIDAGRKAKWQDCDKASEQHLLGGKKSVTVATTY